MMKYNDNSSNNGSNIHRGRSVCNDRYIDHNGIMTTVFIIYKIRDSQGVPILARLIEGFYDKERANKAVASYNRMLSSIEKAVGWVYRSEAVEILDQLDTEKKLDE